MSTEPVRKEWVSNKDTKLHHWNADKNNVTF